MFVLSKIGRWHFRRWERCAITFLTCPNRVNLAGRNMYVYSLYRCSGRDITILHHFVVTLPSIRYPERCAYYMNCSLSCSNECFLPLNFAVLFYMLGRLVMAPKREDTIKKDGVRWRKYTLKTEYSESPKYKALI